MHQAHSHPEVVAAEQGWRLLLAHNGGVQVLAGDALHGDYAATFGEGVLTVDLGTVPGAHRDGAAGEAWTVLQVQEQPPWGQIHVAVSPDWDAPLEQEWARLLLTGEDLGDTGLAVGNPGLSRVGW